MKNNILRKLMFSFLILSLAACDNADKEKREFRKATTEAEVLQEKSNQLIEEYTKKMAGLEAQDQMMRKKMNALAEEKSVFAKNKSAREMELQALVKQASNMKTEVADLEAARKDLEKVVSDTKDQLKVEKNAISEAKKELATTLQVNTEAVEAAEKKVSDLIASGEDQASKIIATAQKELDEAKEIKKENEDKKAALVKREADLNERSAELDKVKSFLDEKEQSLEAQRQNLAKKENEFNAEVNALRELFLKDGKGDVFDKLSDGSSYPFLVSVVGNITFKDLSALRKQILKFTNSRGAKYRKNYKLNPVTKDSFRKEIVSKKDLKNIETANEKKNSKPVTLADGRTYFANTKEDQRVLSHDFFLIQMKASKAKAFRNSMNMEIASTFPQAAAWVIVRPVEKVKVQATMKVTTSNGVGYDQRNVEESIVTKIKPIKSDLPTLDDLNLLELHKYAYGSTNPCTQVSSECIGFLSKNGFLDKEVKVKGKQNTVNLKEHLAKLIEGSIEKVSLESEVRQSFIAGGFQVPTVYKPVEVENSWWQQWRHDKPAKSLEFQAQSVDEFAFEELRTKHARLESLANTPILQKIEIDLGVTMIDSIAGANNSIDTILFFIDSAYRSGEKSSTHVEMPLPIISGIITESKIPNLELKSFDPGIRKPTPQATIPVASQEVLNALTRTEREAIKNGQDIGQNNWDIQKKQYMTDYKDYLAKRESFDENRKAEVTRFNLENSRYQQEVTKALEAEYQKRLLQVNSELQNLKEAVE